MLIRQAIYIAWIINCYFPCFRRKGCEDTERGRECDDIICEDRYLSTPEEKMPIGCNKTPMYQCNRVWINEKVVESESEYIGSRFSFVSGISTSLLHGSLSTLWKSSSDFTICSWIYYIAQVERTVLGYRTCQWGYQCGTRTLYYWWINLLKEKHVVIGRNRKMEQIYLYRTNVSQCVTHTQLNGN